MHIVTGPTFVIAHGHVMTANNNEKECVRSSYGQTDDYWKPDDDESGKNLKVWLLFPHLSL